MTILWAGLSVGAIYTLVALGYNIPLAQTGVFNFAQGQIVVFGTFFAWFVMGDHGWPWWVAIVGGAAAGHPPGRGQGQPRAPGDDRRRVGHH
jgi:branched-chain amino acid transport system permease protein